MPDRVLLWKGGEEDGKDREHVLARLDNMWEDCCGAMWVEVTWYYFPEELHCGRLPAHGKQEVCSRKEEEKEEEQRLFVSQMRKFQPHIPVPTP